MCMIFTHWFKPVYRTSGLSMDRLNEAMCGREVQDIFAVDFDPGVVVSTTDQLEEELEKGIHDDNLNDLPSESHIQN